MCPFYSSGILDNLDKEIDKVKTTADTSALAQRLKEAQGAADQLREEIKEIQKKKADLEKIQTTLTSGLIGAIVTAIIAILGIVFKTFDSRSERDLKRLEVIEKIAELKAKGIDVPENLKRKY